MSNRANRMETKMPTTYKLTDKKTGIKWCARLVFEGDNYGLNHCLEHDEADPMVEFYDMDSGAAQKMRASDDPQTRFEGEEYGQFVSRYSFSTLNETDWSKSSGLNLDGGIPRWSVSGGYMDQVMFIFNIELEERAELERRAAV